MTQLSYEPAFDPFHTIFRVHRLLLNLSSDTKYRQEVIRILDFYLLFPFLLKDLRLQREHQKIRKIAKEMNYKRPYGQQPNSQILFARMEPFQTAAISTMAIKGFLDETSLRKGEILHLPQNIPAELTASCLTKNDAEEELMTALEILADEYGLLGKNGLKARTGLMEYRNDPV